MSTLLDSLPQRLLKLPRVGKQSLAVALDASLCVLTVWLALYLRLEQWGPFGMMQVWATAAALAVGLPIFWSGGLYATVFRYAGWDSMLSLSRTMMIYALVYGLLITVVRVPDVPRSVGIIQPLLLFFGLAGSRMGVHALLGGMLHEFTHRTNVPNVLIYGAGSAGQQLAASIQSMVNERLVGFIDEDASLQGRRLNNVPVYAPTALASIIEKKQIHDILLAIPSSSRQRRKEIIESLQRYPVHIRTLPGMDELVRRGVSTKDIQAIEIMDLLGRDPVLPDEKLMSAHLRGKTVLVTGAGGSIGSELCRQILQSQPQNLLLLEHNEFSLYQINQELQASRKTTETTIYPLQGSAQDLERVDEIMATWRPDIIYHAAAYKHVPLVERNPITGLANNVWGTLVCARAALHYDVERFVLVSTDKAVRPTNVMGASKRLAELVLQAQAARKIGSTCFTMVRFGNVLDSSGSVVPLFRRQIRDGGPITLTHRDITRFFMTIPEASQLVIQAGAMAKGGEVFVLDMGEPVRVYDLACKMIRLSGCHVRDENAPWGDIEIKITGLRPGEKLYEELLIGNNPAPTAHPRILKADEDFIPWPQLRKSLKLLATQMSNRDHEQIRLTLLDLVTDYKPPEKMMDWAATMPMPLEVLEEKHVT